MAASDNLNPDQLRMFMRPQEVLDLVTDSADRNLDETMDDIWEEKEWDLKTSPRHMGLKESISKEGVREPIVIYHDSIDGNNIHPFAMGEGHHRVVASKQLEDETGKAFYLPVEHRVWGED